jgi:hypothetical protein
MALKAYLETLDGLDENLAPHYAAADNGGFQLAVEAHEGIELVDTKGLKSALQKERKAKEDAVAGLKVFEGLDADEARTAMQTLADLGDLDGLKKIDEKLEERKKQLKAKYDEDERRLTEKHSSDMAALQATLETRTGQLHSEIVDATLVKAIAAHDGEPELLLPVGRNAIKVVESDDGRLVAKVIDATGTVRLSPKGGSTSDMTIDEYIGELRDHDKYSRAFNGTGASGGGSSSPTGRDNRSSHTLSAAEALNPDNYRRAKEAAEKAGHELTLTD